MNRALVLPLVLVALVLASCSSADPKAKSAQETTVRESTEFSGYVRTPALDVSSVTLPAADGTPVNMVAGPNAIRLVYFGYTTCPDICPTTLGFVKMVYLDLPEADRARLQLDMVTIDPYRDTAERLTSYIEQFVPTANAIRTDDPVLLRKSARAFGADFKTGVNSKGEREVSHTADLYAVDDSGKVILTWPFGTTQPDFERDLLRLLDGERPEPQQPKTQEPDSQETNSQQSTDTAVSPEKG